jgi:hypothetical protein
VWRGYSIWIETKVPTGSNPTPIQLHRHYEIQASGGYVTVARSVQDAVTWLAGIVGTTDA